MSLERERHTRGWVGTLLVHGVCTKSGGASPPVPREHLRSRSDGPDNAGAAAWGHEIGQHHATAASHRGPEQPIRAPGEA